MKASYYRYILNFKKPGGTSRGILTKKETWFILVEQEKQFGIGECGMLRSLSIDDRPDYEEKLKWICDHINLEKEILFNELAEFPSIQFGLEQALLSLNSQPPFLLFPSDFTSNSASIYINGLIWMGNETFMKQQIQEKLKLGFNCLKMKIGAIDFESEIKLLKTIRKNFSANEVELRVDANGAFTPGEAFEKLDRLSEFDLHSIEQPIKPNQTDEMARLCENPPVPIALDEELIGVHDVTNKEKLIQTIKPQYIILKPSLTGGYKKSMEWMDIAKRNNIGWWVTSALESNIGLNAIAQWAYTLNNKMPQGLGTGSLYTNNFKSPLTVKRGQLFYSKGLQWDIAEIKSQIINQKP